MKSKARGALKKALEALKALKALRGLEQKLTVHSFCR
jgi:hypothetical protein